MKKLGKESMKFYFDGKKLKVTSALKDFNNRN